MKRFGLGKAHKLCSKTAIDRLFSNHTAKAGSSNDNDGNKSGSALAYPVRAVWAENPTRIAQQPTGANGKPASAPIQFLISVPKKRLRHAVDRVAMRRRIREAYRLNHQAIIPAETLQTPLDIAFIYIADNIEPYTHVERSMQKLLRKIAASQ